MGAKRSGYFGKVHTLRRTAGLWLVVVEKVEEYRGRCDDLFADLMECQEQLRVERNRNGAVEMESKRLRTGREWSEEELLLRVDCQHVSEWWRCDGQNPETLSRHFDALAREYGRVTVVNLIDKKKDQLMIGEAFERGCME